MVPGTSFQPSFKKKSYTQRTNGTQFTAAELRWFASEQTHTAQQMRLGCPGDVSSQGVKSLHDTGMMPQSAASHNQPKRRAARHFSQRSRSPDSLTTCARPHKNTSASGLSKLTDVAVMSTACRPNPTTSKQCTRLASFWHISPDTHGECHSYADILRDNVPAVHETARRHFHHQRNLKDRHEDLGHKQLLMTRG